MLALRTIGLIRFISHIADSLDGHFGLEAGALQMRILVTTASKL
jgi:hypothetical protein